MSGSFGSFYRSNNCSNLGKLFRGITKTRNMKLFLLKVKAIKILHLDQRLNINPKASYNKCGYIQLLFMIVYFSFTGLAKSLGVLTSRAEHHEEVKCSDLELNCGNHHLTSHRAAIFDAIESEEEKRQKEALISKEILFYKISGTFPND